MNSAKSVNIAYVQVSSLMTVKEVATMLGISAESTIYRMLASDSTFPKPYVVGRSRRFKLEEINDWLENTRKNRQCFGKKLAKLKIGKKK